MEPGNPGTSELLTRARALAHDHDSGASEIAARLLSLLADGLAVGGNAPVEIARVVLAGKPAMAPLWHACAAAAMERDQPGRFARRRAEMERAPRTLARAASLALRDLLRDEHAPLVLTLSYSSSVSGVLHALGRSLKLRVACAEGRPRLEGRRLALALATDADVTIVTDAALTTLLPNAAAVVVGADAVTGEFWMNKVGSLGVSAAAALGGVPVYVVASRDKFVPDILRSRFTPPDGDAAEIWPNRPPSVGAINPYFERVPGELAALYLTEVGAIAPADATAVAERHLPDFTFLLAALP